MSSRYLEALCGDLSSICPISGRYGLAYENDCRTVAERNLTFDQGPQVARICCHLGAPGIDHYANRCGRARSIGNEPAGDLGCDGLAHVQRQRQTRLRQSGPMLQIAVVGTMRRGHDEAARYAAQG